MIESLEPIYRDALILTELEGWSQKQLAEKAGISLSGAKSRVQRAKEKLKEVIFNCCTYEFDKYGNIISAKKNLSKCCS
jgi:RNA polymerase sigma-70 factor (ECF subfamily)